ncbi:FAD-dependent oxidoreductase [Pseudonocardia alni]|uniref:FAD-dependent oxidoreductase n=1 Tax=Pseudonocardia alni TaxID=33907 RepID=UPI0033CDD1F3
MERALTVAVIGSGPSGFYTAGALLGHKELTVRVDMFERLPTPWGLVRAGVAPDHPKIKSVSAMYEKTAAHERFRFFGNVELGSDVTREELVERYDAVVYAVGAQADRRLGIDGEDLPGSVSAVDFVGWYNGHPDFRDRTFDLSGRRAVVVGNGNVALDVARMLCTPADQLGQTDIADHALEALRSSSIEEVVVIGRRGAAQAAFTTAELQELSEMAGAAVEVDPDEVSEVSDHEDELGTVAKRNLVVLREYADGSATTGARRVALRFLRSPVEILGEDQVTGIVLGRNELRTDDEGRAAAVDTGARETVETGLVLRAVGYKGVQIPGVAFDESRGTIANSDGRVDGGDREYVVGWIKRGPSGIIGTNKKCAADTVKTLVTDLAEIGGGTTATDPDDVEKWLRERCPDLVDVDGWSAIDRHERARGEADGRPRVKLCDREELLAAASEV